MRIWAIGRRHVSVKPAAFFRILRVPSSCPVDLVDKDLLLKCWPQRLLNTIQQLMQRLAASAHECDKRVVAIARYRAMPIRRCAKSA